MGAMNVDLPEALKVYVQGRVAGGDYGSVSEHVHELIPADQELRSRERIDALLLEGHSSGDPIEVTPDYWKSKRRGLADRLAKSGGE